jgi:signal peptidase I
MSGEAGTLTCVWWISVAPVLAGFAVIYLRRTVVVVNVRGGSMEPALASGERVLVRRVRASALRTGHIVVIEQPRWGEHIAWEPTENPMGRRHWMIKRVAALAGEPVPASVLPAADAPPGATVPSGFVVVLGDNADRSTDSRTFGFAPANRILGVMVRRFGSVQKK